LYDLVLQFWARFGLSISRRACRYQSLSTVLKDIRIVGCGVLSITAVSYVIVLSLLIWCWSFCYEVMASSQFRGIEPGVHE